MSLKLFDPCTITSQQINVEFVTLTHIVEFPYPKWKERAVNVWICGMGEETVRGSITVPKYLQKGQINGLNEQNNLILPREPVPMCSPDSF